MYNQLYGQWYYVGLTEGTWWQFSIILIYVSLHEKHKNHCFDVFHNKRFILVFFSVSGFLGGIPSNKSWCQENFAWFLNFFHPRPKFSPIFLTNLDPLNSSVPLYCSYRKKNIYNIYVITQKGRGGKSSEIRQNSPEILQIFMHINIVLGHLFSDNSN